MTKQITKFLDTTFFLTIIIFCFSACNPTADVMIMPPETEPEEEENPVENPTPGGEEIITWKNWYLSVPINRGDGKATSIFYEDIINENLTAEESKYFYKNEDGTYTFWAEFTGFTTSGFSELGDKFCRSELREYWRGNQDVTDNWSMSTGVHILESTMKVDFVEGNGRTIIAQIHGKESPGIDGNPATVKIRWNSGMVQVDHYTKPDTGEPWTSSFDEKLDFGRVDNELFTFKMKIEDGKLFCGLICEAKDLNIDYTEIYDYVGNGYIHENYFKTGNYYVWNEDFEKSAQVTLHKVVTEHR